MVLLSDYSQSGPGQDMIALEQTWSEMTESAGPHFKGYWMDFLTFGQKMANLVGFVL